VLNGHETHTLNVCSRIVGGRRLLHRRKCGGWRKFAEWSLANRGRVVGPSIALASPGDQRDVIEPPSSIDPGMTLDPPQTGAKMPVIRPQVAPGGKLILPH